MSVFNLPDLGEGLQEAEIVAWHVAEGDHVISDQPLVSVETDKAVVEIPAPYSGTVTRLVAAVGQIVPTGTALAEISTEESKDTGAIVGEIGETPEPQAEPSFPARRPMRPTGPAVRATPAVRRLAGGREVDLAKIVGSGPGGTIQSTDVIAAATAQGVGKELRGPRRSMARAMAASHAAVVPATVMDHALIDRWTAGEDPTLRLIHAVAMGCRAEPALNAWFDGKRRRLHDRIDLALAMDTPEGLFTPVLRDIASESDLAPRLADLKAAVRERSIKPSELKDATITLSNFGTIGGEHAVLVVTPPQVAILGAGLISEKVVVEDGTLAPRKVLPLSLSFDHRVVTGGEAARFLNAVKAELEHETLGDRGTKNA